MNEHEARRAEHLQKALAIGAQLPDETVLNHESAAIVLGLPTYSVPAAVRVTRTRGNGFRTSDVHVHRAGLRPIDCLAVASVPVTSPARTVVDLGRRLPFGPALVTADPALRAGASRSAMQAVLRHQWTWPMVRHAMPVVSHADARSESPLESFTRARVILLRLPIPELQADVFNEFGWVARTDFEWKQYGVVGEADGRVKYLADELWAEKQRQEEIEDAGREVIRWIWRTAHAPDEEFTRRLLRKFDRGLAFRRLRSVGT